MKPPLGIRIRILTPADAAAFQTLRLQALAEDPVAFASSYEEERDTPMATVAERLQPLDDRAIVGAFDHGHLVGLAAWHREEMRKLRHKGFVWGVFVAPTHRGQGLARRLLEAVIALARNAEGIRQLNLTAYAANQAAVTLYESLGFVVYGREPAAICVDGMLHDDVHMSLRL
ncbi:GNAT family N-acetyltransferase [Piscinibacter sp. XHJ-5]|uniref:GNAT family N-acetyltransferase n=1 Tax=Piscinibacter sp. XHJ-5 TaxID=3037797 RepID=UPI002452ABDC|nr:GNAT family N-acetyltransferase [Piscinibacter sp. XHJ-5]